VVTALKLYCDHSPTKNAFRQERVFHLAGRTGFEPATGFTQHSLSRRAHSATLAPPRFRFEGSRLADAQPVLNEPSNIWLFYHATHSGGSGIRTHVGVTQTCFQDMRLQPLGHPSMGSRFRSRGGRHFTISKTRVMNFWRDLYTMQMFDSQEQICR
jgi:hypothetical protein